MSEMDDFFEPNQFSGVRRVVKKAVATPKQEIIEEEIVEYEDIEEELKLMVIENFRLDNSSFLKIKSLTEQISKLQKFYPVYEDLFLHLNNDVKDLE